MVRSTPVALAFGAGGVAQRSDKGVTKVPGTVIIPGERKEERRRERKK